MNQHAFPRLARLTIPDSLRNHQTVVQIAGGGNATALLLETDDIVWSSLDKTKLATDHGTTALGPNTRWEEQQWGSLSPEICVELDPVPTREIGETAQTVHGDTTDTSNSLSKVTRIAVRDDRLLALKENGEVWHRGAEPGQGSAVWTFVSTPDR